MSILSEEQMGFGKGQSCTDATFTLQQITDERVKYNLLGIPYSIYRFRKAFDNVNRDLL